MGLLIFSIYSGLLVPKTHLGALEGIARANDAVAVDAEDKGNFGPVI